MGGGKGHSEWVDLGDCGICEVFFSFLFLFSFFFLPFILLNFLSLPFFLFSLRSMTPFLSLNLLFLLSKPSTSPETSSQNGRISSLCCISTTTTITTITTITTTLSPTSKLLTSVTIDFPPLLPSSLSLLPLLLLPFVFLSSTTTIFQKKLLKMWENRKFLKILKNFMLLLINFLPVNTKYSYIYLFTNTNNYYILL